MHGSVLTRFESPDETRASQKGRFVYAHGAADE
jgi:hypothetical protein